MTTTGPDGRNETPLERLDRHWAELLQELRVVQTGVQLLTGFLLTLPFQQRFTRLDDLERGTYLVTTAAAILATVMLQAPVIVHRSLFRRHRRAQTVLLAHRLTLLGIGLLGVAVIGVSTLIASVVLGTAAGLSVGAIVAAAVLGFWVFLPLRARTDVVRSESDA
ncbi:DUF6328 family protein [Jatrophihabitans fulvus]